MEPANPDGFDVGQIPMKKPSRPLRDSGGPIAGTASLPRPSELSAGRLLIIFGPMLAVGASTVLLALVAGLFGFHRYEMYLVATVLGALVMLLAVILFYRQTAEQKASELALQNAEARVGGLVDAARDAIISTDDSQRIVLYNAAAESLFGWPRPAVLLQPLDRLIPERLRAAHRNHIERFGRTGVTSRRMGDPRVLYGLRANGEEFPIEASISQHQEGGRKLFTVILRDVTERLRAEEALRESKEELRELALASHSVREQEKSRIARELHDELAQSLTALKMDVAWLRERFPAGDGPMSKKLSDIDSLLNNTVAATRRISADLRPLVLDDLGLVPAVEWLVQKFTERNGIPCELAIGAPDLELGDPHASAVFRILQESLTNAARHARASRIEVSIERSDGVVALRVRDNGRGFSPDDPRKPGSFGLMGLRERAYLLGGEVNIASEPGRGTTIEVRIPLESRTVQP
jgi:PAS domain S-box-containing protein